MEMDLLYILGTGSKWNDNELRFSLRSVAQNLSGYRYIWIVGVDPGFVQGIKVILHPDEIGPHNADGNITRKIIRACREKDMADNILLMNDDYIINRPLHVNEIYPMHKGNLAELPDSYYFRNAWRRRLMRTRDVLVSKGLIPYHLDYHAPLPVRKADFARIVSQFDYEQDIGYTTRSIYGNVAFDKIIPLTTEKVVVFNKFSLPSINQLTMVCNFVSYNDDGLHPPLKYWLASRFPNPCKYEVGDFVDPYLALARWHDKGMEYEDALQILKDYPQTFGSKFSLYEENPPLYKRLRQKLERKSKIMMC